MGSPAVTANRNGATPTTSKPWEDDGPTDLDNGLLLCRRHHNLIHHTGWRLQRDPGTGTVTARSPDGREFTRRPGQTR